jgi:hypothetical protein
MDQSLVFTEAAIKLPTQEIAVFLNCQKMTMHCSGSGLNPDREVQARISREGLRESHGFGD